MDVYVPPDLSENEKRPVVIFLHGGGKTDYTPKDWGVYTSWGRLIAASGFVGVTFTHRLEYPTASLEKAAVDVLDAIKYVRANAEKYGIALDHVALQHLVAVRRPHRLVVGRVERRLIHVLPHARALPGACAHRHLPRLSTSTGPRP